MFKSSTKLKPAVHSMIRVNHAGELGADRIYAGQMAVLGGTYKGQQVLHMWQQEKEHRKKFEELIRQENVRPTLFWPIWNVAGWTLGATTAALGPKAAMACTVAVETVIVDHYNEQIRELANDPTTENKELMQIIKRFRDEEQEHHDIGIDEGAEQAPMYKTLTWTIKMICKGAIAISKRI